MKRIDYYATGQPGKLAKWLGVVLGGVFGAIALGCGIAIFSLTRSPIAAAAAVAALPAQPSVSTPAAAAPEQPAVAADDARDEAPAAPATHAPSRAAKHAKSHRTHAKVAVASKRSTGMSDKKAHQILAKHDSRDKRRSKDDLDRLLGL